MIISPLFATFDLLPFDFVLSGAHGRLTQLASALFEQQPIPIPDLTLPGSIIAWLRSVAMIVMSDGSLCAMLTPPCVQSRSAGQALLGLIRYFSPVARLP
jgi:hypothetical protein